MSQGHYAPPLLNEHPYSAHAHELDDRYEALDIERNPKASICMKLHSLAPALLSIIACISLVPHADSSDLPSPWQHQDIGTVTIAGSASAADGVVTLRGTLDI